MRDLDGLILAVNHRAFLESGAARLVECLGPRGIFVDVKSCLSPADVPAGRTYWSL